MRRVTKTGTVTRLSLLNDFEVCAKTGIAQVCAMSMERSQRKYLEHAWFVSFFSYKSEKPMVLVIMLEHEEDSKFAVTMAGKFLRAYRHLREINAALKVSENGEK